ncbi:MAG: MmcQ/YjbR family DNA-binding protein [Acidobacteria bacterium]|nr:MmcQ/YjbR family DNA-binding protein [Acidobacteriota bacterium]
MPRKTDPASVLRTFALKLPGAHEDFPWGERVAKVGGKVFVFLGKAAEKGALSLAVKLPASSGDALDLPFTEPTGYGLGKSGWVTATFAPGQEPPVEILTSWLEESYRAVAPKKLVAELDARKSPASRKSRTGVSAAKKK